MRSTDTAGVEASTTLTLDIGGGPALTKLLGCFSWELVAGGFVFLVFFSYFDYVLPFLRTFVCVFHFFVCFCWVVWWFPRVFFNGFPMLFWCVFCLALLKCHLQRMIFVFSFVLSSSSKTKCGLGSCELDIAGLMVFEWLPEAHNSIEKLKLTPSFRLFGKTKMWGELALKTISSFTSQHYPNHSRNH